MSYFQFQYKDNGGEAPHGSFEVFERAGTEEEGLEKGWYWWPCFPGCLPDGEPSGPFLTAIEAQEDAQDGS